MTLRVKGTRKSVKVKQRREEWGCGLLGTVVKQVTNSHVGGQMRQVGNRGASAGSWRGGRVLVPAGMAPSPLQMMLGDGRQRPERPATGGELVLGFPSPLPPPPSSVLFTPGLRAVLLSSYSPERRMALFPAANLIWSHSPSGSSYRMLLKLPGGCWRGQSSRSCPASQARQAEPNSTLAALHLQMTT